MSGNKIEINAGTGGKVKKMTVAAIVDGGVNCEVAADAAPKDKKEEDRSNDHFVINGPSGNAEIDEMNLLGKVKGGINNKLVKTNTAANTADNSKTEEEPMVLSHITSDNLDGLQ